MNTQALKDGIRIKTAFGETRLQEKRTRDETGRMDTEDALGRPATQ
jgi:hypothetical protein